MKAKEIMTKYDISRQTLCHWVKEGKIKTVKLPNGQYSYLDDIATLTSDIDSASITDTRADLEAIKAMFELNVEFYGWLATVNFMGPEFYNKATAILNNFNNVLESITHRVR